MQCEEGEKFKAQNNQKGIRNLWINVDDNGMGRNYLNFVPFWKLSSEQKTLSPNCIYLHVPKRFTLNNRRRKTRSSGNNQQKR